MLQKTVLENSMVMNSSIFVETAWSLWMKEFFKSYNLFNHCLYQLTCSNTASINQSVQALSLTNHFSMHKSQELHVLSTEKNIKPYQ